MKRLTACLLCMVCLFCAALAESADVQSLLEDIRLDEWQRGGVSGMQAWLDGPLAAGAGTTAEWYVLALAAQGQGDFTAYRAALQEYLDSHTVRSATTRLKYAMALLATGTAEDPDIAQMLAESMGQQGLMSTVWGLLLMNNGVPGPCTADEAIDDLLSARLADGGWALNGASADVDVTAMTLQALAPHRARRADVAEAVEASVALLSARQQTDGGFASYGVACPESAAQVLIALSALDIDGLTDPRFLREGKTLLDGMTAYAHPEGGYSHTAGGPRSHNATVQVYLALTAYQRFLAGQGNVYLFPAPAISDNSPVPESAPVRISGKTVAVLVIAGVAAAGCVLLFLLGKRHWKNFLALLLAAAVAILLALTVEVQSAGDYYGASAVKAGKPAGSVTLEIRCDTVAGRADYIPADGVILAQTAFPLAEGDTVYTILTDATRAHRIHLESSGGPGMAYIEGMAYLYEQGWGDLSGWLYAVNGETSSLACDQYVLRDGDRILWAYTLEMGEDLK